MDLSAYSELKFTVCNENKVSCLQMYIQLQDVPGTLPERKQVQGAMNHHFMLYPGETRDISVKLPADLPHPEVYQALVGMRNTPYSIDEHYVRTALQNPCVIGVQWHQYADQATTGRFDGENYHVGLLDVCDTPYYETIDKVREVGYGMYEIRWKK